MANIYPTYPRILPGPVLSFSLGPTNLPTKGIENSLAIQGIVDTMITIGNTIAADSNHLSTSSSLAMHPHECPKAISVVKSMTKNDTRLARSSLRRVESVEMYCRLIRSRKPSTYLSSAASTPSTSFPEY
jgi:hypothetical protein